MIPRIHLCPAILAAVLLAACGDDSSTSPAPDNTPAPVGHNGITVISPNGGESFQVAKAMPVRWNAAGEGLTGTLRVRLSCNSIDWYDITGESIPNERRDTTLVLPEEVYSRSLTKMIPLPTGSSCKVMIQDYSVGTMYDTSDVAFTVKPK